MSYTATTTAPGTSPDLNLDAFGYPPAKAQADLHHPQPSAPLSHPDLGHRLHKPSKPSPSAATDDEDVFSLDMVTMDMGFEQAYYMYMLMQQKNALSGVEELQRAQQMDMGHAPRPHYPPHALKDHHAANKASLLSPPGDATEEPFYPAPHAAPPPVLDEPQRYADGLAGFAAYNHVPPKAFAPAENALQLAPNHTSAHMAVRHFQDPDECDEDDDDSHDEVDQFFSSTESNALDKFLDSLATSNLANPLDLYSYTQPVSSQMFDLRTMGVAEQKLFIPGGYSAPSKAPDSFTHPLMYTAHTLGALPTDTASQLPTPNNSRQVSTAEQGKRPIKEETPVASEHPRKRKVGKALLSLAQKRLNHSHSEQKRRLLCKQAYERCLRLVTNVDDYKNELVSASALTSSSKHSKRKQINKDGLPNLSKHAALLKIGFEIIKIRDKNEKLQELIAAYS